MNIHCDLFLVLIVFSNKFVKCSEAQVILHTEKGFKGMSLRVSSEKCTPQFPKEFQYQVSSIEVPSGCIQLYDKENCSGNSVEVIHGVTPLRDDLFSLNFDNKSASAGPCNPDPCAPNKIENLFFEKKNNFSSKITLWEKASFRGAVRTVEVGNKCVQVPRRLKKHLASIEAYGTCFQLYEEPNCSGDSRQFWSNIRSHDHLNNWYFKDKASSISLCGYNCLNITMKAPIEKHKLENTTKLGLVVTLFDEKDFNGNWKDIKVHGCTNVTGEWEGVAKSVKTYGNCIKLYQASGCITRHRDLQLSDSNQDLHNDLSLRDFEEAVRSIGPCDTPMRFPQPSRTEITDTIKGLSSNDDAEDGHSNLLIIIISSIAGGLIILLGIGYCVLKLVKKVSKKPERVLTDNEIQEFLHGSDNDNRQNQEMKQIPLPSSPNISVANRPYDNSYEIPIENIQIDMKSQLGSGEFAVVYNGSVKITSGYISETISVAVKSVKPFADVEYIKALLKEIKTMIYVGKHRRIVTLVGCCTRDLYKGKLLAAMELCVNGSLESYLRANRKHFSNMVHKGDFSKVQNVPVQTIPYGYTAISSHLSLASGPNTIYYINGDSFNTLRLLNWALQIAEGMQFLFEKRVIHGDLATRNVLLDKNLNVKISDFGLSKKLYNYSRYTRNQNIPLPWAWLPPESLKTQEFSSKSDIWSFGVTLWEIFSMGDVPYAGTVWNEHFLPSLMDGLRLSKPPFATSAMYNLMLDCWREEPSDRVSFSEIIPYIQEHLDLQNSRPKIYAGDD